MKQIISPKLFSSLIFFLSIVLLVKIAWTTISLMFLPSSGEEFNPKVKTKALYYRVRLSNNSAVIAPIIKAKPKRIVSSMRGIKLIALYNASDNIVITVEKNRKAVVLSKGDKIDGFVLKSAGADYAIFVKNGKEFKLTLNATKTIGSQITPSHSKKPASTKPNANKKIKEQNGVKVVNRNLLTSYTSNPKKIWKDIGISENKLNGKLHGFKINYVKKGSDFEKLGLKRGDLLTAINAEELDNLGAVMSLYGDINNIENLTLTVERNGKSEDIEYEIQ
ncbi:General secretion pathway protein C [hydrothermal vent metagenome]|uniref:General secretion pathway protein C n=1 Tax=hydrothermal vent metagenome TaxID=652676 RepID=A0A1W1D1J5_9ZZZZ